MSTSVFPGSPTQQWEGQRSDWRHSTRNVSTIQRHASELMRHSLKRIGEVSLIIMMVIGNVLAGLTLLIGLPVAAVLVLASAVTAISGAIATLGTVLEFLGLA